MVLTNTIGEKEIGLTAKFHYKNQQKLQVF